MDDFTPERDIVADEEAEFVMRLHGPKQVCTECGCFIDWWEEEQDCCCQVGRCYGTYPGGGVNPNCPEEITPPDWLYGECPF
jgi:hypothetical protein